MPDLGEQVEAQTTLDTTRTTASLGSIALCDEGLDETTDLTFLVKAHLTMLASVNDTSDVGDGNTGFRDVRGCRWFVSNRRIRRLRRT